MIQIGVVGHPNTGKSSFFNAATMQNVAVAAYPFTTIKPNVGTAYAETECVCKEFNIKCNPQNSACKNGKRLIPVQMIDVAGLVPDAHLGKGLGNQFLNDLTEAEALIHVVDLSGKTDEKGEMCENHDPEKDILFLENEIDMWLKGILEKNWKSIEGKAKTGKPMHELVYEQLSGFGLDQETVKKIIKEGYTDLLDLAKKIRKQNKPIVLAGNKIDTPEAKKNYERLKSKYEIMPCSAEAELVMKKAAELQSLNENQQKALNAVKRNVADVYGSAGVQRIINKIIFEKLNYIEVYPVEDEKKLTNKQDQVLPDVFLMKKGSTAFDLAKRIHTEIAEKFKGAIDARTKRKLGKDYELKKSDVIKILV